VAALDFKVGKKISSQVAPALDNPPVITLAYLAVWPSLFLLPETITACIIGPLKIAYYALIIVDSPAFGNTPGSG
jgi:hypothetical protein